MCGIVGIIGRPKLPANAVEMVRTSTRVLAHRGPDNQQLEEFGNSVLGHSRLSVIDTSSAANQPMFTHDRSHCIVFNGEIYNHAALRTELSQLGIVFSTNSDTETLLYGYKIWGSDILHRLNGFFSFAIYDKKEGSVFLARDRFGIKPLVYTVNDDFFAFASEIKGLLTFPIEKSINQAALGTYLQFSYIPAPFSIYNSVRKLPGGHWVKINSEGQIETKKYYELSTEPALTTRSFKSAAKEVERLVVQAVNDRMMADVPLGAFLSGGVDSSIVALCASQNRNLDTFSVAFKGEQIFDESRYARQVADFLKTNHHEIEISAEELLHAISMIEKNADEPFADSSAIAVNVLSEFTRKHITVALSGDGADELFSGYNKHEALFLSMNGGWKQSALKSGAPLLKGFGKNRDSKIGNFARRADKFSQGLKVDLTQRYSLWARFTEQKLASKAILDFQQIDEQNFISKLNNFNDVLANDFHLVLQNDMLTKVDNMSMQHSLEVRTPFLDHRLVNYVFSLPSEYKINKKGRKLLLKSAFRNQLPENVFTRKKHGFEVPLTKWFHGPLDGKITNYLLNRDMIEDQGLFHFQTLQKICSDRKTNRDTIWALLQFQNWYFKKSH